MTGGRVSRRHIAAPGAGAFRFPARGARDAPAEGSTGRKAADYGVRPNHMRLPGMSRELPRADLGHRSSRPLSGVRQDVPRRGETPAGFASADGRRYSSLAPRSRRLRRLCRGAVAGRCGRFRRRRCAGCGAAFPPRSRRTTGLPGRSSLTRIRRYPVTPRQDAARGCRFTSDRS